MKKISLIIMLAGMAFAISPALAQNNDTTKNNIEIKKKVKTGAHGRKVTKIKMTSHGTEGAISGTAEGVATGKTPTPPPVVINPAPVIETPPATPIVETPPPAPAPPTVIVVPEPKAEAKPVETTTVTTTTETKPVAVAHVAHYTKGGTHVYHHVYKRRPTTLPATKTTTTTTTTKKTE